MSDYKSAVVGGKLNLKGARAAAAAEARRRAPRRRRSHGERS
jgi:hypothetical protein